MSNVKHFQAIIDQQAKAIIRQQKIIDNIRPRTPADHLGELAYLTHHHWVDGSDDPTPWAELGIYERSKWRDVARTSAIRAVEMLTEQMLHFKDES